jgi:hypothetical protein
VFASVGYLQFGADVSGDLLTEWMGDDVMTAGAYHLLTIVHVCEPHLSC